MAGDITGMATGSSPEIELASRLKELEASQIAEILRGFCSGCHTLLKSRLLNLTNQKYVAESSKEDLSSLSPSEKSSISPPNNINHHHNNQEGTPLTKQSPYSLRQDKNNANLSPASVTSKPQVLGHFSPEVDEEEWSKFSQVGRKKNFVHYERVDGKNVNVLQGLELHTGVFSDEEQKKIVQSVYNFQSMGRKGQLMARTFSEPKKWMRGKGRVTIQFGCCYNYAVDKDGNPPGILRDEEVDPLPPVFKQMIRRMVRWHVLPPTCIPNSCIVNIYDEGDCIPPHVDHHDFLRPFCTVSFLAKCNILFGTSLKVAGPGEFSGPVSIPLPVGSVLVLKDNGADIAKHCVPAVPAKRISVTFRRMDDGKIPYGFAPDPDLLNLKPLLPPSPAKTGGGAVDFPRPETKSNGKSNKGTSRGSIDNSFVMQNDDFPPLGGLKLGKR